MDSSNSLSFQCGNIVDVIGTPELGKVGGTRGNSLTVSASNIKQIGVTSGNFAYDTDGKVITNLKSVYNDNTTKSYITNGSTTYKITDTFVMLSGYVLGGFLAYGNKYLHALQFHTDIR